MYPGWANFVPARNRLLTSTRAFQENRKTGEASSHSWDCLEHVCSLGQRCDVPPHALAKQHGVVARLQTLRDLLELTLRSNEVVKCLKTPWARYGLKMHTGCVCHIHHRAGTMCAWCRYTRVRFECTHGGVFESTHGWSSPVLFAKKSSRRVLTWPQRGSPKKPLDHTHFQFETRSRTTCPRFIQSFALPDKAVQCPLS